MKKITLEVSVSAFTLWPGLYVCRVLISSCSKKTTGLLLLLGFFFQLWSCWWGNILEEYCRTPRYPVDHFFSSSYEAWTSSGLAAAAVLCHHQEQCPCPCLCHVVWPWLVAPLHHLSNQCTAMAGCKLITNNCCLPWQRFRGACIDYKKK